jgi:UDP-glucose 4-epimerase
VKYLLLGASGILGTGFRAVLRSRQAEVQAITARWGNRDAVASDLRSQLPALLAGPGATTVVWAAGAGSIGASAEVMRTETGALADLCELIERHRAVEHDVRVIFASSAGALFGGVGNETISPESEPKPITPYGWEKLAQEDLLRQFADDTGCRVVACRFSNLYGLAGDWLTARGLVATAVRATRLRQPMTIFVSADTRRDLVFNRDAAGLSLQFAESSAEPFRAGLVVDGTTRTVSEILSIVGAVSGRRVPATYAERPETRFQPTVLRFARPQQGPQAVRRTQMETAVHRMMRAPMSA